MPRSCPVCGSRKWRKDAISGNAACEEGHVFQDYRSENLVVENVGHALQKRTFRKGQKRNKRKEEGRANASLYHGEEAEWLKLQALQLMLRLQVQELRRIWQLPAVFETIVRELWAYQLATAQTSSPPFASTSNQLNQSAITGTSGEVPGSKAAPDGKEDDKGDSSDSDGDGFRTEKEEDALDPELLAELSDLSDQSEDEGGAEQARQDGERGPRWKRRRRLRATDTLVTLILGCWILRVPVMNVDVEGLVNDNRIPYLDFARTTFVTEDMFKRMNREVRNALLPRKSPTPLYLFEETRLFARILSRHFGLLVPEINLPPVSWRVVSSLGATPSMYHQVHRLLALLDVNLMLVDSAVTTHSRKARRGRQQSANDTTSLLQEIKYERTQRNQDTHLPEVSVAAGWVIVMKLAYGLDANESKPLDELDAPVGMPSIDTWLEELKSRVSKGHLKGNKKEMEKQDFPSMPSDDIDRYLDLCEQVLLGDHPLTTDAGPFPLLPKSDLSPNPPHSWMEYHQSAPTMQVASPVPTIADQAHLLPGEEYESYDAQDVTGTLPERYEVVLNAAAQVVGVKPFDLGIVVELFERRLAKVRKEQSRSRSRSRAASESRRRRGLV